MRVAFCYKNVNTPLLHGYRPPLLGTVKVETIRWSLKRGILPYVPTKATFSSPSFEYQLEPLLQSVILLPSSDHSEQLHTMQWLHPVQSQDRVSRWTHTSNNTHTNWHVIITHDNCCHGNKILQQRNQVITFVTFVHDYIAHIVRVIDIAWYRVLYGIYPYSLISFRTWILSALGVRTYALLHMCDPIIIDTIHCSLHHKGQLAY